MGSVLASSVIRDVQAKDAEHPNGWTATQKWALAVIADAANYKTGLMVCSMQTLADLAGINERTVRAAVDRALAEGRCVMDGYYYGKTRCLRFPNPTCIGEPEASSAPTAGEPEASSAPTAGEPESGPEYEPETSSDIPVVPVVPVIPSLRSGTRAGARAPRGSSDIGLTAEDIAERNRLDLEWKRRREAEAVEATQPHDFTSPNGDAQARLDALAERHAREDAALDAERAAEDAARADLDPRRLAADAAFAAADALPTSPPRRPPRDTAAPNPRRM
jgi:hypothetical protein